jgi:hypothetical protein
VYQRSRWINSVYPIEACSPYFLLFNSITRVIIACILGGSYLSQDIDWRYRTTYGYTATNWRKM